MVPQVNLSDDQKNEIEGFYLLVHSLNIIAHQCDLMENISGVFNASQVQWLGPKFIQVTQIDVLDQVSP